MTMGKMTFAAIIFCGRDYAALTRSLEMDLGENVKRVFLFGGDAPKRYEIPPKVSELLSELSENGNGAIFYNPDLPETLTKIDAYLRECGADAWFFLNAGDTVHTLYTSYLESFFSYNKGKCGVVFAPVLMDGIKANLAKNDLRLPKAFQDLPKNGLFSYADDYERFPKNENGAGLLDGAAVLAEDVLSVGLDIGKCETAYDTFFDLIDRTAQDKVAFGRLNMIYISRNAAEKVSKTATAKSPITKAAPVAKNQNTSQKYLVSCVIPIYNAEKYLSEAIDSVVRQTIGFVENVQLILVNDGSTDNSGEICTECAVQYPDNVLYVNQPNGGEGAARNAGIAVAEGAFIAFLDADDVLEPNYFDVGLKFLRKHNDVDFVAFPLKPFGEARRGEVHPLDYKFIETKVVDIAIDRTYIQLHAASSLIRREAVEDLRFVPELKYGTDAEFMHRLVYKKKRYGVSADTQLLYRKHGDSALARARENVEWYNKIGILPKLLMEAATRRSPGKPAPFYTQYTILYDLQWYGFDILPACVSAKVDLTRMSAALKQVLKKIDDDVILAADFLDYRRKVYFLKAKHGRYSTVMDGERFAFGFGFGVGGQRQTIVPLELKYTIGVVKEDAGVITVSGFFDAIDEEHYRIAAKYCGNIYGAETNKLNFNFLGDPMYYRHYATFTIPYQEAGIKSNDTIEFYLEISGFGLFPADIVYTANCRLSNKVGAFVFGDKAVVGNIGRNKLAVEPFAVQTLKQAAVGYANTHFNDARFGADVEVLKKYFSAYPHMSKRRIWLFMDRPRKADDNAEFLFRYCANVDDGVEKFFVIDENTEDAERLKEFVENGKFGGNVNIVSYGSDEHKLLHLFAEKYISSTFEHLTLHPFGAAWELYKGLLRGRFVFLTHGATKDDMSRFLNRWVCGIDMFITASRFETTSIFTNESYGYDKDVVKLTGYPRYDAYHAPEFAEMGGVGTKKQIVFMPTWRHRFAVDWSTDGTWGYNVDFKKSEFFEKISAFLNDETLLDAADRLGYGIAFRPHPNLCIQLKDFELDERVTVIPDDCPYRDMYAEAALMVTDYSSAVFDFAYLKKPVVYWQFDKRPLGDGYFDYDLFGFGEVVKDKDALVALLIKYMENGCVMGDEYARLVDDFFTYHDGENCKRVYEAITAQTEGGGLA